MPFLTSVRSSFGPVGRGRKLFNLFSGGTVSTINNYNGTGQIWAVHQFTTNGTLTIVRAPDPFRVLVSGGGGGRGGGWGCDGCCSDSGGGGAGFRYNSDEYTIDTGSFSVSVGGGGSACGGAPCVAGGGGTSSIVGTGVNLTGSGGGGGGNGGGGCCQLRGCPVYGASGGTFTSNITGTSVTYGSGSNPSAPAPGERQAGRAGIVVVAYRIG